MAQKTVVQLVDDLTGEELRNGTGETVQVGLDGVQYELDLSNENAAELRRMLGPYLEAARRVGANGRRARSSRATAKADTEVDPRAVREWAEANGVATNKRGRLSADVIRQYRDAGN